MNGQTSLDLLALDDNTTQLRLAQGTLRLRVRQLFEGQRLEVDRPTWLLWCRSPATTASTWTRPATPRA